MREAVIQTNFKELYDIEHKVLALRPAEADRLPKVESMGDLEGLLDSSQQASWLVDPSTIQRGELMEVEVELEADPIFGMATVIATFFELMEDSEHLLGSAATARLPEIRSAVGLLENLLGGLVPIRGHLVDYDWTQVRGCDVLVHRSLLRQIPLDARPKSYPAVLVGVTQRDLFWKDIRRVLFSQARYTVFCRLATSGLMGRWNPIKMADVFSSVAPDFDELIQNMGDELISGFKQGVRSAIMNGTPDTPSTELYQTEQEVLERYAESLADHHNCDLEPADVDTLTRGISRTENWLASVDYYRPVFAEVTTRVDNSLQVKTPADVACDLRFQAVQLWRLKDIVEPNGSTVRGTPPEPKHERFLDTEVIAIYW